VTRVISLAGLLVASAGCSLIYQPDEARRPSSPAEVDAHFSARYAAVLEARATCSGTSLSHARTLWLGPMSSFLDRQQAVFAGGNVRLDRVLARQCLDAIAAAVPACTLLDAVLNEPAGSCRRSFAGVVADGADCASDAECHADARCVSGSNTCPGHCTRYRAAGELCEATIPCGFDLRCGYAIGTLPSGPTHCFTLSLAEGGSCGGGGQPPCGVGLHCNPNPLNQICVPLLGYGGGCGSSADCRPELRCEGGSCIGRVAPGLSCTPSASGQCVPYAWCDNSTTAGTCAAFISTGSCGTQGTGEVKGCLDGECVAGNCALSATYGGACTAGQRCAPIGEPVSCDVGTGRCGELCQ
jgi:hypothetical protein